MKPVTPWLREMTVLHARAMQEISAGAAAEEVKARLLVDHVLPGVVEVVGCSSVSYNEVALAPQRVVHFLLHPPEAVADFPMEAWEAHAHEHPVLALSLESPPDRALAISDLISADAFHATALWRELYRHGGVEDQLSLQMATTPSSVVALACNSLTWGFTEAQHEALDLISAWLGPALTALTLAGSLRDLVTAGGTSLALVFLRDGVITEVTSGVASIAATWDLDLAVGSAVPDGLVDQGSPARRLEVRRHAQGAPGLQCLQLVETLLDPAQRATAAGLSTRELEVLQLAQQGRTNAQIADQLGLSVRTVDKHLQGVYRTLGVSSRTQAIAWLVDPG